MCDGVIMLKLMMKSYDALS